MGLWAGRGWGAGWPDSAHGRGGPSGPCIMEEAGALAGSQVLR